MVDIPDVIDEVHVICCNDGVVLAVIGTLDQAEAELERLASSELTRQESYWKSQYQALGGGRQTLKEYYRYICRWHIRTTPLKVIK